MNRTRAALLALSVGLTATAAHADGELDGYTLYGFNRTNHHLYRYDFAKSAMADIGLVKDTSNQTLGFINAAAYVPGFQNIFAFWTDPDDNLSKLIYVDTTNATGVVMGNDLGPGRVTGATAVAVNGQWQVYAVQTVESSEDENVDFDITGGQVVPTEPYAAKITVLGAAISMGTSYNMMVTTRIKVGGTYYTPWGSYTQAVTGNVNDNKNPRTYILPNIYAAGTPIAVLGRSWQKTKSSYNGSSNSHWETYMTADSSVNSPQIKVLRNGDKVPKIKGFENQADIQAFVQDFIDVQTGKIVLDENQAIYLFELGTTSLTSSAADFQDLVVLVTLAKDAESLIENDDDDTSDEDSSRLLQVNQQTGGYVQLMTLDREYDALATKNGTVFYGTHGESLYKIDVAGQTETLIGSTGETGVHGLEYAGNTLVGFEITGDTLSVIDASSGGTIGAGKSLNLTDLGTIVFTPAAKTVTEVNAYD